ncbi:hypothetical protein ACM66B_000175 [Microbotryomycetes sp. NB124-2]
MDDELDFGEDELDLTTRAVLPPQDRVHRAAAAHDEDEDEDDEDAISFGRASPSPGPDERRHDIVSRDQRDALDKSGSRPQDKPQPPPNARPSRPATVAATREDTWYRTDSNNPSPRPQSAASGLRTPVSSSAGCGSPRHDSTLDEHGRKLPPNWVSKISRSSLNGKFYYRHTASNKTTWDVPTSSDPPKSPPSTETVPDKARTRPSAANTDRSATTQANRQEPNKTEQPRPSTPANNRPGVDTRSRDESARPSSSKQSETARPPTDQPASTQENATLAEKRAHFVHPYRLKIAGQGANATNDRRDPPRPSNDRERRPPVPGRTPGTTVANGHAISRWPSVPAPTADPGPVFADKPRPTQSRRRSPGAPPAAVTSANAVPVAPRQPKTDSASTGSGPWKREPVTSDDTSSRQNGWSKAELDKTRAAPAPVPLLTREGNKSDLSKPTRSKSITGTNSTAIQGNRWAAPARPSSDAAESNVTRVAETSNSASQAALKAPVAVGPRQQASTDLTRPEPPAVSSAAQAYAARAKQTSQSLDDRQVPRAARGGAPAVHRDLPPHLRASPSKPNNDGSKAAEPVRAHQDELKQPTVATAPERRRSSKSPPLAPSPFTKMRWREAANRSRLSGMQPPPEPLGRPRSPPLHLRLRSPPRAPVMDDGWSRAPPPRARSPSPPRARPDYAGRAYGRPYPPNDSASRPAPPDYYAHRPPSPGRGPPGRPRSPPIHPSRLEPPPPAPSSLADRFASRPSPAAPPPRDDDSRVRRPPSPVPSRPPPSLADRFAAAPMPPPRGDNDRFERRLPSPGPARPRSPPIHPSRRLASPSLGALSEQRDLPPAREPVARASTPSGADKVDRNVDGPKFASAPKAKPTSLLDRFAPLPASRPATNGEKRSRANEEPARARGGWAQGEEDHRKKLRR